MHNKLTDDELKDLYHGQYVKYFLERPIERITRLLPYLELSRTDVVADFGCGPGMLAAVIYNQVAQYVGIDWSDEFIDAAQNQAKENGMHGVSFECGDIVNFCQRNKKRFDKAFTLDFSEHIYDKDFIAIYTAIRESLKPGGVLYLHTPNGSYLVEILKKRGVLKQTTTHVAVRNAREHILLLREAGFNFIMSNYLPHYIAPLSHMHFLSRLPYVGELFKARLFITCEA